jgi:hypothetical protein
MIPQHCVKETHSFNVIDFIRMMSAQYLKSSSTNVVVFLAVCLSCAIFVMDCYDFTANHKTFSLIARSILLAIFSIDFFFHLVDAASIQSYLRSSQGLIDILSLASLLEVSSDSKLTFVTILRFARLARVLQLYRLSIRATTRRTITGTSSTREIIYFETITLLLGIFIGWLFAATSLFLLLQSHPHSMQYALDDIETHNYMEHRTLVDCFYIILVLVSTLGYGDFYPSTQFGRLFVMAVLLCAITIIPQKVGQLISVVSRQPAFVGEVYFLKLV